MESEKQPELATILGAASEQIGLALMESHGAVQSLGASLERITEFLTQQLTAAELVAMRPELTRAVTGLQFYDRMVQHLNHVREYLDGSMEQLQRGGDVEQVSRRLADRLLFDTQRIHLSRDLATEFLKPPGHASMARSKQGDVDLF